MAQEDLQWLTQPPAPGEVRLHVALGEGAQLTPEVQDALERLVRAVQAGQGDVQGFGGPGTPASPQLGAFAMSHKFQAPMTFTHKFQHKFQSKI